MNRMVGRKIGTSLITLLAILLLACAAQAAAPVSPPESRFVWEPGEKLTFTWTNENFDGFYYDAQNRTGKESLTIKLNKIENRSIPDGGLVYSTKVETATARYRPFGEYAVIWFMGGKYLTGFPEGKSNITAWSGINLNRLYSLMIDDGTSHTLINGSNLTLDGGYVLEVRDVDAAVSRVTLSLMREGIGIDTKTVDTGKNYIYEIQGRPVIAVHIDSIHKDNESVSVAINGIFQASEQYTLVNDGDIFGRMKITKVSDTGITMSNFLPVELKRGSNIDIGELELKVADSNTLRVHLYKKWLYVKGEHRGATGGNNLTAWDGLNYAGFSYDADSGNYSESLVITNLTGRRIPEGGLTYTSYRMRKVPYAVTNITGKKPEGTDGSYVTFSLGGKKYTPGNNGFRELLIAHGDSISEKEVLLGRPPWFEGDDKLAPGLDTFKWGMDTWGLGEGYTLTVKSIDTMSDPRKAQLFLNRSGVELDDVWLSTGNAYIYFQPGETGTPKLITYLYDVFSGATVDAIQLRYTWFVSDNVTRIKEGDRLGVFNVTVVEPDRIVLTNREPIDLKAGSSINLFGNLSFFVENSDELRFYPTNMAGTQVMPEEVTEKAMLETPEVTTPIGTSPVAARTERAAGFQVVISIMIILAVYIAGRKME